MAKTLDEVMAELPPERREKIEAEYIAVIKSRLESVQNGTATLIEGDSVFEEIERELS